jgi:hypothetical protein
MQPTESFFSYPFSRSNKQTRRREDLSYRTLAKFRLVLSSYILKLSNRIQGAHSYTETKVIPLVWN